MTSYPVEERQTDLAPELELNPWIIRIPILAIIGGLLFFVVAGAMIGFFRYSYQDRITPGVSVSGVDLSGMSRDEALTALGHKFNYDQEAVFTLTYASSPELDAIFAAEPDLLRRTAGQLGVSFDLEATVERALELSSGTDVMGDLVDQAFIWFNGESIAPIVRYDQEEALSHLLQIAERINKEPTAYNAQLQGDNIVMGENGRELDINATLRQIDEAVLSLRRDASIPLIIHDVTPPSVVMNAEEVAQMRAVALSAPLILTADDGHSGAPLGPWEITPQQIEALLKVELVENSDGTTRYEISADMNAFVASLEQLAPGLVVRPEDARFHFDEVTRQLIVVQPSVNGRRMNLEETLNRMEQAVFRADNRVVPIAFDYTLPRYHDGLTAAELGITQLVSESTTYYTGSDNNRRHNIAEGASRIDGVIIGPGEEFSFNYFVGDISLESGFREGKVIVGGRTVAGVGGGICQVSTTIFRAAFSGGFQIIERNSHAYRVGYYELGGSPPGLDAAIWSPERDFRFQNDTPYSLLIETSIFPAENALQFRIYSTNPGRVVEIEQPSVRNVVAAPGPGFEANRDLAPGQVLQVDYAAEGADVNVKRIIRDMQGNVISEDNIFTHYLPWQAIFQVHPNDSRLNS